MFRKKKSLTVRLLALSARVSVAVWFTCFFEAYVRNEHVSVVLQENWLKFLVVGDECFANRDACCVCLPYLSTAIHAYINVYLADVAGEEEWFHDFGARHCWLVVIDEELVDADDAIAFLECCVCNRSFSFTNGVDGCAFLHACPPRSVQSSLTVIFLTAGFASIEIPFPSYCFGVPV